MARKDEIPSLENALESGFSELKGGEENIKVETGENKNKESARYDHSYGLKIDAKETREKFISRPITATKKTVEEPIDAKPDDEKKVESPVEKEENKILDSPTSNIGDDFDVSW